MKNNGRAFVRARSDRYASNAFKRMLMAHRLDDERRRTNHSVSFAFLFIFVTFDTTKYHNGEQDFEVAIFHSFITVLPLGRGTCERKTVWGRRKCAAAIRNKNAISDLIEHIFRFRMFTMFLVDLMLRSHLLSTIDVVACARKHRYMQHKVHKSFSLFPGVPDLCRKIFFTCLRRTREVAFSFIAFSRAPQVQRRCFFPRNLKCM